MGLSMSGRKAVTKTIATRYAWADKADKGIILDELCATTGWHRNHARKALTQALRPTAVRRRTPRSLKYGSEVIAALRFCWAVFGAPAGKRLAAMLPDLVPTLRRFGELSIDDVTGRIVGVDVGGDHRPSTGRVAIVPAGWTQSFRSYPYRQRSSFGYVSALKKGPDHTLIKNILDGAATNAQGPDGVRGAIPAGAIRTALLTCAKSASRPDPRGLVLMGAEIHGALDLSNLSTSIPLRFVDCVFRHSVFVDNARLISLEITDCESLTDKTVIVAEGMTVTGDLVLDGFIAVAGSAEDKIRMSGSSIDGGLLVRNVRLTNTTGTALSAARISVKRLASFISLTAESQESHKGAGDAVRLSEARFHGRLNFVGARLTSRGGRALVAESLLVGGDAHFEDCRFVARDENDAVQLDGSRFEGQLSVTGTHAESRRGTALGADGITVAAGAYFVESFTATATGFADAVSLTGAKVGGDLSFAGAHLTGSWGNALNADRIDIGGNASFAAGLQARTRGVQKCAVRLVGAKIGGKLSFESACLDAKHGIGLYASHVSVAGTAEFTGVRSSAGLCAIQLGGAQFRAHVIFDRASLTAGSMEALAAEGIRVDGQATFANGLRASSNSEQRPVVALGGARIGGQLDFTGARLTDARGTTLAADSLTVHADVILDDLRPGPGFRYPVVRFVGAHIRGKLDCRAFDVGACVSELNLRYAEVGTLRLNAGYGWPGSKWLILDGLTYEGIPSNDMNVDGWVDALANRTPSYSAQPWQQLGMAHKEIGHDQDAIRILISQRVDYRNRILRPKLRNQLHTSVRGRRELRDRGATLRLRLLWSRILETSTGYGYRSHRAFLLLLAVVVMSIGLTLGAGRVHIPTAPPTERYVAQLTRLTGLEGEPCSLSEQIGLGLQIGLPLIKTPAGDRCRLDTESGCGQTFTVFSWILQALAWLFATLAIAGYTGLIRKL